MINKIQLLFYYAFYFPLYKMTFGKIGSRSRLIHPRLTGRKRIFIGSKVYMQAGGWLAADPVTHEKEYALIIGDGTYIGRFAHIYASSQINIGKKVLIADKVYISDNVHGYTNIELPIIDQPVRQLKKIVIGDGAWIGENACVIGASVGKNSVIGANAVVTKDIPDLCVAVGMPAKIIKRYDHVTATWRETHDSGQFI